MPRGKSGRTMSGAPAQAPAPVVDGTYGDGEAALEAQRRMPTPNLAAAAQGGQAQAASGPGGQTGGRPTLGPQDRLAMAQQMLGRMQPTGALDRPSERPDEPITAGLAQGPGPGPEVLKPGDRATRTLRMLADYSDDPGLAELADLAQRMGR